MIECVRGIAERVARSQVLDVVEVGVGQGRGSLRVRVFVDRPGGVGIEELKAVSEEISAILDVEEPIDSAYTLEVSSPGLDRPLRSEADFRRCIGRMASMTYSSPTGGDKHLKGRVESVTEGVVRIRPQDPQAETIRVPIQDVAHARIEVEFSRKDSSRRLKRRERKKQ